MALDKLNKALAKEADSLQEEGRAKAPERIIVDYIPPQGQKGPRYKLKGANTEFIRMNSNSYLSLSNHPKMIEAADQVSKKFGVGPGAVRFIDGTFQHHAELEERIAMFVDKPAAKIFNSAYTTVLGLALAINNKETYWIGDELNHNCIIRSMRIANVPQDNKAIYKHNDLGELKMYLQSIPDGMNRVVVIFDGIFSMRGDCAPINEIVKLTDPLVPKVKDGVITVVDDSHGIGAYGETGRGTSEFTGAQPDVIIGTFGKALGVNGGFVASSEEVIEAVRQKADTYIYTNPLSVADCAAAIRALEIADSREGRERLQHLHQRTKQFREGIDALGMESIPGPHPVVPLLVRETAKTHKMVNRLYEKGVLVVGLTYPVVPKGDETIRFQINAAHTKADVDCVLDVLSEFRD
ncbi:aminotransferase class I/II-fold pyridoxal phosphate-dependent enzyme [candidate division KSB1 bacterium]|nr:aminotransferase class I/II-fold pyridoxal phosphate-dependent enzyme [candidate division KSB1 bacterium]NIS28143.1 aminotransferase class I/II-fold pyridoxal phosphate-dependent enzyme [candidate division KSB1 bacterium]NIT75039.1 aminotransferase class I/II-fold pyridoxal phosphate-dependent enzyme [candidate division KSB1 bacterium]NIU23839.1 aminotransferase class I/II-fold pyridoxal phosphate-dependent enzyme [candidate division KSB1 bacterium]NIU91724.1 aminotransferase class I/II-fold